MEQTFIQNHCELLWAGMERECPELKEQRGDGHQEVSVWRLRVLTGSWEEGQGPSWGGSRGMAEAEMKLEWTEKWVGNKVLDSR